MPSNAPKVVTTTFLGYAFSADKGYLRKVITNTHMPAYAQTKPHVHVQLAQTQSIKQALAKAKALEMKQNQVRKQIESFIFDKAKCYTGAKAGTQVITNTSTGNAIQFNKAAEKYAEYKEDIDLAIHTAYFVNKAIRLEHWTNGIYIVFEYGSSKEFVAACKFLLDSRERKGIMIIPTEDPFVFLGMTESAPVSMSAIKVVIKVAANGSSIGVMACEDLKRKMELREEVARVANQESTTANSTHLSLGRS